MQLDQKIWCPPVALGRLAQMPPDEARRKAAEIIDRIKRGLDPVSAAPAAEPTVADLAERCMEAHVKVNCRPNAVESLGRLMRFCILPELGGLRLSEVDRPHYSALHHKMRDKPQQANTMVGVIAWMFRLAEAWGMTQPRPNLCRSVRRYRETPRELCS